MKHLLTKLFVILGVCLALSYCAKPPAPKTPPTKFSLIGVWGVYGITTINHAGERLPKKEPHEQYSIYWTFQDDGVFHYSRYSREGKPRTSGTYTYDTETRTLTLHYPYGDKEAYLIPFNPMEMEFVFYGQGIGEQTNYYLRKYDWDEEE